MTPFEFCIYASGLCGFMMVAGAIWLLNNGVIKLVDVGKKNGLSVDVLNKVKISTGYPALGLFLIGLLFLTLAIYNSKPNAVLPLTIVGKLDIDDTSTVTIKVEPDMPLPPFIPDSDGGFDQVFRPEFGRVRLEINAAGYTPTRRSYTLNIENLQNGRRLTLPTTAKFTKLDIPKPVPGDIAPVPANVNLAPLIPR